MKESDLYKQVIDYLTLKGFKVWRNNTGAYRKNGRLIKYGEEFSPDVIGYSEGTGIFIGIECKKKGEKLSDGQKEFLQKMKEAGCISAEIYTLDDLFKIVG